MDNKSAPILVTWSGQSTYTLTTSFVVASDEILVEFAKRVSIYPYYNAGTGATIGQLNFILQANALDSQKDPSGLFWTDQGSYTESSGTWTEEVATYVVNQGAVGTYRGGPTLDFSNLNAQRIKIKVKEVNPGSGAGTTQFIIVKNNNF